MKKDNSIKLLPQDVIDLQFKLCYSGSSTKDLEELRTYYKKLSKKVKSPTEIDAVDKILNGLDAELKKRGG